MRSKLEFDRILSSRSKLTERIQMLGSLLAKDSGLGSRLVIAGGSAISIYTEGRYVSGDIDIVGEKRRIVPVLERWGFAPVDDPDGRVYWARKDLGLFVDIVHRSPGSGSGRSGRLRTVVTRFGPVRISAVEDLIVRRLVLWSRFGKRELIDQAVVLYTSNREEIDRAYLEGEVRWERVEKAYGELRRLSGGGPLEG
jgi:hypothetical protein